MKIWLVWECHDLWAIFTTKEQAEEFIKKENEKYPVRLEIEMWEIT